uniref:Uncharacterized protein n=1 Tax=Cricetulus griseus TaxID=10029 RepID=A0A8C2MY10_CRIGR
MRSGDKGHRGYKGHRERNQVLAIEPGIGSPFPVSCQGWTRQGLVGKDQPPLSTGLPAEVPQDLAKRGRDVYICLWGLKAHHPEIQEYSSSHWPTVLRLQLEFVAEIGREPYHEPSQPPDIPAQSRREEETRNPSHIPTPQRPADRHI